MPFFVTMLSIAIVIFRKKMKFRYGTVAELRQQDMPE